MKFSSYDLEYFENKIEGFDISKYGSKYFKLC